MIIISPTTESGLSESYSVMLPNIDISIEAPKAVSVAKTIGGAGVVSIWSGNIAGETRTASIIITTAQYESLKSIVETSVDTWLLRMRGRIFKCAFDLTTAKPNEEIKGLHDVSLFFAFISEVTNK